MGSFIVLVELVILIPWTYWRNLNRPAKILEGLRLALHLLQNIVDTGEPSLWYKLWYYL